MNRGGNSGGSPFGLHEVEHHGLPQDILQDDPVGVQHKVTGARNQFGPGRVVQMAQQDLLGQG